MAIFCLKAHLDPYHFTRFCFARQKISKIWIFRKSYGGEVLEKVENLTMEVCPIPSIFHISYLNLFRRVALRQKPFFKGPSIKNLHTIND